MVGLCSTATRQPALLWGDERGMSLNMSKMLSNVVREYPDYLRDESRTVGSADSISFPTCEAEILEILQAARNESLNITIQGARTGLTAGAVPHGGHILNLSKMTDITGLRYGTARNEVFLTVQPGVLLSEITSMLQALDFDTSSWDEPSLKSLEQMRNGPAFFFPPDPTETSASIGGMVNCNASGSLTLKYGSTRNFVHKLRIIMADGTLCELTRGEQVASGRHFSLPFAEGQLPSYATPNTKNAAGYYVQDDMDLIDLFIGAEGTLGVISEITLRLIHAPVSRWGVTTFLPSEAAALDFVSRLKAVTEPAAIEFFDYLALNLLSNQKDTNPAFSEVQALPAEYHTAVYVEYHAMTDEDAENAVLTMSKIMVECGGDEDTTWIATEPKELEKLRAFRHSIPEAVNLLIDERKKANPELTKLGTDMSVPDTGLHNVMKMYRSSMQDAGMDYVIFGHIGNNHLHVNILPNSNEEHDKGKEIYLNWAGEIVKMGGSVSAEHGIGKLKTAFLELMYSAEAIDEMRALKKLFDPKGMLNRGNLFDT